MPRKHIEDISLYYVLQFWGESAAFSLVLLPALPWRANRAVRWILIALLFPALCFAFIGFSIASTKDLSDYLPSLIVVLYPLFFAPTALILWALFWPLRKKP